MRRALDLFNLNPYQHEISPKNTAKAEVSLLGTHLRDVLLRTFSMSDLTESSHSQSSPDNRRCGAFVDDMRIMSWAKRYREKVPLKMIGDPDLDALNASQTKAIALMLAERVSLVQGVRLEDFLFVKTYLVLKSLQEPERRRRL